MSGRLAVVLITGVVDQPGLLPSVGGGLAIEEIEAGRDIVFSKIEVGNHRTDRPLSIDKVLARQESPGAWFSGRYGEPGIVPIDPGSTPEIHKLLGSEAFVYPWLDRTLTALSNQAPLSAHSLRIRNGRQSIHHGTMHGIQLDVELSPVSYDPLGYVLTLTDPSGKVYSVVLPTDPVVRFFRLEIDRIDGTYTRFAVFLSPDNRDTGGEIACAWDRMRALSAVAGLEYLEQGKVLRPLDGLASDAERALAEKVVSPLAATIAAALLLRTNRLDIMRDWTRNLANWSPGIPDGVVFWTEQLRRKGAGKLDESAVEWFVENLQQRSVPFTSDAFGLSVSLLGDIVRAKLPASEATRSTANRLRQRYTDLIPYFRDDGLFCAYVGLPDVAMIAPIASAGRPIEPGEPQP